MPYFDEQTVFFGMVAGAPFPCSPPVPCSGDEDRAASGQCPGTGLSLTVLVAFVGLQSANRESETEHHSVSVVWVYLTAAFFIFFCQIKLQWFSSQAKGYGAFGTWPPAPCPQDTHVPAARALPSRFSPKNLVLRMGMGSEVANPSVSPLCI